MAQEKASPGERRDGARKSKGQQNGAAAAPRASTRAAPLADESNEMGGFFVDPVPSERVERPGFNDGNGNAANGNGNNGAASAKGNGRASDRRREQGRAPEPQGPKDTRTSLKQNERLASPMAAAPQMSPSTSPPSTRPSAALATLACVKGPETGTVLTLADGSYTVGRARENQLVLKDIAASRMHLRIDVEGRRARMTDLGSGNGTRVNGKRAGEVELRHGDTIEIGSSLLLFSEAGKQAPQPDQNREDAQARVVAAADELARELSQKMRFGEDGGGFGDDGFVAKTRALKTADARAVAEQIQREAAQANGKKKNPDQLWSETFTNMPLSAVIPAEQPLQGGAREAQPREAPPADRDLPRARTRAPAPSPFTAPPAFSQQPPPQRQMAPQGTAAGDYDESASQLQEFSEAPRRGSFLTSVLLSAGVVVVVGALALGMWAIFFKDDGKKSDDAVAAIAAEREAEYATAISRAQTAVTRADWVGVRDYAQAALQVKPGDVLAETYKRDAELKVNAALDAANKPPPVPPPTATPTPPPTPPPTATPPVATPTTPPVATPTPPVQNTAPKPPKPKPAPKPRPKGMSDGDAQAQFERAIDAFRSKDNDTACNLLDRVADRAPADSVWKGKAESLYLKKCGD